MIFGTERLHEQLQTGVTTIATLWGITRLDGAFFGFTDHDLDLDFGGNEYLASSGLGASAITQGLGLAVDNTEAAGALDDERLRPEDIDAGLFDDAQIEIMRINWQDTLAYENIFSGHLGQMQRDGHAFRVEMRGYMDRLQMPMGRVYGRSCSANLGDSKCGVPLSKAKYKTAVTLNLESQPNRLILPELSTYETGWFTHGTVKLLSGALVGQIRRIRQDQGQVPRYLSLWEPFGARIEAGTEVELVTGCNRSFETCKNKFDNCIRFAGFPFLPNEDWLVTGVGRP